MHVPRMFEFRMFTIIECCDGRDMDHISYTDCVALIASLCRFSGEVGESQVAPLKAQGGLGHFCRFMSVLIVIDAYSLVAFRISMAIC